MGVYWPKTGIKSGDPGYTKAILEFRNFVRERDRMTPGRYWAVFLLALAVAAAVAEKRVLDSRVSPLAVTTISSPASASYLVILGVGDQTPTTWDGSITATGATITSLQGWRFDGTDSISATNTWKMGTDMAPAPPNVSGVSLMQENGLIVTIPATTSPVTFAVKTTQGNFRNCR